MGSEEGKEPAEDVGRIPEGKRPEDVLCDTEHPGDAQAERDAATGKYTESISGEDTGSFLRGGAFLMR